MTPPLTWKTKNGTARILPERGRILGMEVGGQEAMWSPSNADAQWNLGGERLWVGPEADWFWKETGKIDLANYQVPPALDPDLWTVTESGGDGCRAELDLTLHGAHDDRELKLRIQRVFEPWSDSDPVFFAQNLSLRLTTTLEILGGTAGQSVDLWSILQVPLGGEILMPTQGIASPRDYFDPCPMEEMVLKPGLFGLRVGGKVMFKVGISPDQTLGRIAYARPVDEGVLVTIREFPFCPSMHYCDGPLGGAVGQGDAVQFFNDGGRFGNFAEIEHRSPALVCEEGPQKYTELVITRALLLSNKDFIEWKRQFSTDRH